MTITLKPSIDELDPLQQVADVRDLLVSIPVGTIVLDRDGRFAQVNREFLKTIGREEKDFLGKTVAAVAPPLFNPETLALITKRVQHRLRTGESITDVEVELLDVDGNPVPVSYSATGIRDQSGEVVGEVIFATDISERKRAERKALEQHERLLSVFDGIDDVIYVADMETHEILFANKALKQMAKSDPVGRKCYRVLQNREAAGPICTSDRITGENLGRNFVWKFQNEVTKRWYRCSDKAIQWTDGRWVRFEIAIDITEERHAQEVLRESEEAFSSFFNQGNIGAAITSPEKGWVQVNTKLCEMLGYSRDELTQMTWEELTHPDDVAPDVEQFQQLLAGTIDDYELDKRFIRKDGSVVFTHLTVSCHRRRDGSIKRVLATLQDMSKRKQAEADRAAMEAQLRQSQKLESIGTLAGGVAHEINNPINGIMNYAQLIADRASGDGKVGEFAAEIVHETERVATIVKDLLAFARQDSDGCSRAQVHDVVERTLSLIRTVLRHDQIDLRICVPEDLPEISCNSQQIQQVLMNLITNARDALNTKYVGHDRNKRITVSARELVGSGPSRIRIAVEDTGPGIPDDVRERMFDPFYTTKPREKGTGLGLSISHGIVRDHHGKLSVETELGSYTRFHIDLPLADETGDESCVIS